MNYKITKITDYNNSEFQRVFTAYFNETGIEIKKNTDLWNKMENTKEMYCYAIENEGQIIGFIMFQKECLDSSTGFFSERVGYIRELYVCKDFRKLGFASLLIDIAEKYFKQNSVFKIILTCEKDVIDFYKKLGFTEDKSFAAKNNLNVMTKMIGIIMTQEIDGIKFKIKEPYDFGFLSEYGKVFKVFDDQDSGNICFGTKKNGEKFFIKFAGARTAEYDGNSYEAVSRLKSTVPIYENLKHDNLIEYIESKEIGNGFAMVFKWTDGICMGRMYPEEHRKFVLLSNEIKLKIFEDIFSFMEYISRQNFVAIDFYDGSIMYDFDNKKTIICDVDFFRKSPTVNDMGRMWGSSAFMSPEEFKLGATIDEITNVYTLGAMAFALFGNYKRDFGSWTLNKELFEIAAKATSDDRSKRHQSIKELIKEWDCHNI